MVTSAIRYAAPSRRACLARPDPFPSTSRTRPAHGASSKAITLSALRSSLAGIAPARPFFSSPRAVLAVGAFLVAVAGCSKQDAAKPAGQTPEAGFVTVKIEPVALGIELGGRTNAYEASDVRPQVSGVIQARLFEEGTMVRAGQTLYRIDPSLYKAAEDQARANLASAEAAVVSAEERAKRYKPLADIEAVSRQDYADALATSRQAVASVAQTRAALQTAQINHRFTTVPAPISGRIGRSLVTTGALVTANQTTTLTTIQRLDPIFVDIQQSSADLLALRKSLATGNTVPSSAEVTLVLEDGSTYGQKGRLEFSEVLVDQTTGSVTLRARFPNAAGLLLPGMYVRARFSQATLPQGMLVPQAAVSRDARGDATVMTIGPDDKIVQKRIVATRTVGDQWLVSSGLAAGDRVVTEGLGRIKIGQAVKPVAAGTPNQIKGVTSANPQDGKKDAPATSTPAR